ncbi:MAG: DUF2147 domain-containing protein [Alphaproteobacteria bacterium]|nr:MAG: DUF2147 domain-containing protein [Alphaproteobacteria bacterium]
MQTGHKIHSGLSLPLLMLSFGAATGLFGGRAEAQDSTNAPPPTPTQTEPGHSFWKHPEYDAVLEVWVSPASGLRGKLVSLNPADQKVKAVVAKILKKDEKKVSDADVLSFQGMEGDLRLKPDGENKWTGSIYWPFRKKSYGVDVEQTNDNLHVHGFLLKLPILGKSVDLKPAAAPRPKTP